MGILRDMEEGDGFLAELKENIIEVRRLIELARDAALAIKPEPCSTVKVIDVKACLEKALDRLKD